jgi:hypothetical protein
MEAVFLLWPIFSSVPNALFFLQKKDVDYLRKRCFLLWFDLVFGEGEKISLVFLLFE